MDMEMLSGNDTTGGAGLLSKWRAKRTIRKREKAERYLDETKTESPILSFLKRSWLLILIIFAVVLFLWKVIFRRKAGRGFRRKSNSGRSFYLRMKRAKARKRGK
jgi:hypothetical protein